MNNIFMAYGVKEDEMARLMEWVKRDLTLRNQFSDEMLQWMKEVPEGAVLILDELSQHLTLEGGDILQEDVLHLPYGVRRQLRSVLFPWLEKLQVNEDLHQADRERISRVCMDFTMMGARLGIDTISFWETKENQTTIFDLIGHQGLRVVSMFLAEKGMNPFRRLVMIQENIEHFFHAHHETHLMYHHRFEDLHWGKMAPWNLGTWIDSIGEDFWSIAHLLADNKSSIFAVDMPVDLVIKVIKAYPAHFIRHAFEMAQHGENIFKHLPDKSKMDVLYLLKDDFAQLAIELASQRVNIFMKDSLSPALPASMYKSVLNFMGKRLGEIELELVNQRVRMDVFSVIHGKENMQIMLSNCEVQLPAIMKKLSERGRTLPSMAFLVASEQHDGGSSLQRIRDGIKLFALDQNVIESVCERLLVSNEIRTKDECLCLFKEFATLGKCPFDTKKAFLERMGAEFLSKVIKNPPSYLKHDTVGTIKLLKRLQATGSTQHLFKASHALTEFIKGIFSNSEPATQVINNTNNLISISGIKARV
jgi:hypothetical protein